MSLYSIYASFRHPQTGREVATIELDISDDPTIAESITELTGNAIDNKQVSIVEYLRGHFLAHNDYMPLVVAVKRQI